VYSFVHVMRLCVYVNMVCQQCMLYDDMYSHDICHDHMCVSYNVYCVMVTNSAYLGFPGLKLEESGSSGRTDLHVVSGGIVATLTWPSVGVKPNTWKELGFGVLRDSRMFRAR
jgi:hypothetical protein